MMKLIHMLTERFIPHILRLYNNMGPVSNFDAIRQEAETLALRDWIYEPLSCSVASDVQELIIKMLDEGGLRFSCSEYAHLLVLHPKCCYLSSRLFLRDMSQGVIGMLQSLICLEHIEWLSPLGRKETDMFTTSLKYCTRLKVFEHESFCNDEIIKVLSQNCPLLSVLYVEDSKSVTDESTQYIGNMKSLRKCCIKATSITIEGIVSILKNCMQLCHLDMSYNICNILGNFEDDGVPIQLSLCTVKLNNPCHITPHLLKKYCPFLIHVSVDFEWKSEPPCHLMNVERLSIIHLPCCYSALDTWLILENINVISLFGFKMSDEDLVELSNVCQNITELYVEVFIVKSNMHSVSEHRPFQKLKILRFEIGPRQRQFIETHALIFKILLSYSTMVTHVTIENLYIDDRTVETIFKTNKMRYLQYWQVEHTVCTSKTFYLLFNMCPMLKFIGKLRTWEIHPDEVQEIENFIRQENYNLDIDI